MGALLTLSSVRATPAKDTDTLVVQRTRRSIVRHPAPTIDRGQWWRRTSIKQNKKVFRAKDFHLFHIFLVQMVVPHK